MEHAGRKSDAVAENGGGRPRCLCWSVCTWSMVSQGRPYNSQSAGVESNRPVGIAVMALLFKYLQYIPRRIAKQRHGGATEGERKPYAGLRDTARLTARQSAERGRSEHAGGKSDAVAENGGRATEVSVRAGGHGPWRVEGVRAAWRAPW